MDKIKVPAQSVQSIEKVFDDIQDHIKTNTDRRLDLIFKNFGINKLVDGTSLELGLTVDTSFNLQPGIGITNNHEWIKLPNIEVFDLLDTLTPGNGLYYVITLKWISIGTIPVPVANGFNYNGESAIDNRMSKYSDSYEIAAVEITTGNTPTSTDDELLIAIVKSTDSTKLDSSNWVFDAYTAVNGVVDLRESNTLEYQDISMDPQSKLVTSEVNHPDASTLYIRSESTGNGNVVFQAWNSVGLSYDSLLYINETDKKIGINKSVDDTSAELDVEGEIKASGDIYSNDKLVLTDDLDAVLPIQNLRITSIKSTITPASIRHSTVPDSKVTREIGSDSRNYLLLYFKWGYDRITGIGGTSGSFVVDNAATTELDVLENELEDMWLWHPGKNENYRIIANAATAGSTTELTLQEGAGGVPNLTGFNITSPVNGTINHNVTSYDFIATPMVDSTLQEFDIVDKELHAGFNVTFQSTSVKLAAGVKYMIQVRANRGLKSGTWTQLPDGTYEETWGTISYGTGDGGFIVKHADLLNTNSTLTALATGTGFHVEIGIGSNSGEWKEAEEIEVAWSAKSGVINFDSTEYESKILARGKTGLDITTIDSQVYNVSVRPLIGGLEVISADVNTTVTSGSKGVAPQSSILLSLPINLKTYSGNVALTYSVGMEAYIGVFSSLVSPASSLFSIDNIPDRHEGSIVTFDGNDYMLEHQTGNSTFILGRLTGGAAFPGEATYACEINTSERGRRVSLTTIPADVRLTKLSFDCDVQKGDAANLRVFQQGRSQYQDSLLIDASDEIFAQIADQDISEQFGTRTVQVDFYDDTVADLNKGNVQGRLLVYAIPYTYSLIYTGGVAT